MEKNAWLRLGLHLPRLLGTAAAVLWGNHIILSGYSRGEVTRSLFFPVPFHRSPPPSPLTPVRMRTWPQAPCSPIPNTKRSSVAAAHPHRPQPMGDDTGPEQRFCPCGGGSMQQCCEGKLPAAAPAPKTAMQDLTTERGYKQPQGFSGEEEGAPRLANLRDPRGGE